MHYQRGSIDGILYANPFHQMASLKTTKLSAKESSDQIPKRKSNGFFSAEAKNWC